MKIRFLCNCGRRIKVHASKSGKKITCPLCKKKLKIPALDSPHLIGVECECGEKFPPSRPGCPSCERPYPPLFDQISSEEEDLEKSPSVDGYQSFLMDSVSLVENLSHDLPLVPRISTAVKILWGVCILITLASSVYIFLNLPVLSDALAKPSPVQKK